MKCENCIKGTERYYIGERCWDCSYLSDEVRESEMQVPSYEIEYKIQVRVIEKEKEVCMSKTTLDYFEDMFIEIIQDMQVHATGKSREVVEKVTNIIKINMVDKVVKDFDKLRK